MENVVSNHQIESSFWRNKKVLITGLTGFKGSWLGLWLTELGAEVIGYSLEPPTEINHYDLLQLNTRCHSIIGDVRDYATLAQAIKNIQPEIIIHMAAQSLVRYSYEEPIATFATNVLGTVHLLEAARHAPSVKVILNVTSDKCYDNKEWLWGYRENEAMGGSDPYSSSKGCAELVTQSYQRSYFNAENGIKLASARAGNVIGGGDWAQDRLIPDIMQAFLTKRPAVIRNPNAIRPWQHVLEPLSGYMQLIQMLAIDRNLQGAWNFGPHPQDARPVAFIVEQLAQHWGQQASWQIEEDPKKYHEAHYLRLDCSKANTLLGWQPRWGLTNALEKTAQWYQAYANNQDIKALSLQQIKEYSQSE